MRRPMEDTIGWRLDPEAKTGHKGVIAGWTDMDITAGTGIITIPTDIIIIRTGDIPTDIIIIRTAAIPTGIIIIRMAGTPMAITADIPMADTAILGDTTWVDGKNDRQNHTSSHFTDRPRPFLGLSYLFFIKERALSRTSLFGMGGRERRVVAKPRDRFLPESHFLPSILTTFEKSDDGHSVAAVLLGKTGDASDPQRNGTG
jgi:hypothetical protein